MIVWKIKNSNVKTTTTIYNLFLKNDFKVSEVREYVNFFKEDSYIKFILWYSVQRKYERKATYFSFVYIARKFLSLSLNLFNKNKKK